MSQTNSVSRSTILAYGSVGLPLAIIGYPIAIWLPAFYGSELGVSLAAVGTILMLARFTDVLTDPLIGHLSDRFRTRLGRRKPWLLGGVPVMMLGIHMLFQPSGAVGGWYLLVWVSVMMLGMTMIALPYGALGAELSPDYHQRSRITAGRELFVLSGLLVAALIPAVVQHYRGPAVAPVMAALSWAIMVSLPLVVLLLVLRIQEPPASGQHPLPLRQGLRLIWHNGPMKRIVAIHFIVVSAEAFRNALSIFFMRDVIGIPKVGILYLYYFATGLAAIPIWLWLGAKIDKHRAFCVCLVAVSCISVATFFLGPGDARPFAVLFVAKGFCFGGLQFLPLAMLADVIDVDTARSGRRRAGIFFAFEAMSGKMARAVGTGLALNVAAWGSYVPSSVIAAGSGTGLVWLAFLYAVVPAFFFLGALRLTWKYPLTAARHHRLRLLIETRAARRRPHEAEEVLDAQSAPPAAAARERQSVGGATFPVVRPSRS